MRTSARPNRSWPARRRQSSAWVTLILALALGLAALDPSAASHEDMLIIDDRSSKDYAASSGGRWRLITDGVMGGVSSGSLEIAEVAGRPCLRLRGSVRLENNGGFVQAALDLGEDQALNAADYEGVELEVHGNDEAYNLHLRTRGLWFPWQSYRASFTAQPRWQTVRLPFAEFERHKTRSSLDLTQLARIGIVAIGREFAADLCIARVALYASGGG